MMSFVIRIFLPIVISTWILSLGCSDSTDMTRISTGKLAIKGEFLFARTAPGTTVTRIVSLENVGQDVLTLAEFKMVLPEAFSIRWLVLDGRGKTVDAGRRGLPSTVYIGVGEELRLSLTYAPVHSKVPDGLIRFRSNSGVDEQRLVSLPVAGLGISGELLASASELNFGHTPVGQARSETVWLINAGHDAVHLKSLSVQGSSAYSIRVRGQLVGPGADVLVDPDGDGKPGLAPSAQVEVEVVFRPTVQTPSSGELVVNSDGRPETLRVALLGNGAGPCVRVVPGSIDFPTTAIGAERTVPLRIESCGTETVAIGSINLTDEDGAFRVINVPETPTRIGGPFPDSIQTTVVFKPTDNRAYGARIRVSSDVVDTPLIEVPLVGRGIENQCPIPRVVEDSLDVRPLDVVTLDGSNSIDLDGPDGRPVAFAWSIVERPRGSTTQPVEGVYDPDEPARGGHPDQTDTAQAQFFVDLAGEYVAELVVTDHYGASAPSELCPAQPARVRIRAVPEERFHVQLTWDTPGDANQTDELGTDVDLHLRHPLSRDWFADDDLDCYFQNQNPDWGRPGQTVDDPSLDIDDVDGAGPENINIHQPQDTEAFGRGYSIGVHYYSAESPASDSDFSPLTSTARLRVYVDGRVAWEAERQLQRTDDFWYAADVYFSGAGNRIEPVNTIETRSP